VNVKVWRDALRGILRLNREEWDALDPVARWLVMTRAAVLIITLIPCLLAGIFAWRDGQFDLSLWLITTFGLIMAHASNNILNDMTDHVKGVDKGNYFRSQYGVQPLEHGLLTLRQAFGYLAGTGFAACVAGSWLIHQRGTLALILMAVGAFFVLFYTWPLKYIGLGEFAVFAVWGPLMTGGAYFTVTGHWSNEVALFSLPYALGATIVLFGKHIDKLDADKAKGIRTFPVLLGERNARVGVKIMIVLQFLCVLGLVVAGYVGPWVALVLISLRHMPIIWKVYSSPRPAEEPEGMPPGVWPLYFVAAGFVHNRAFGMMYFLGIVLDVIWKACSG
jgi:1,4-dihydroxy-2-naphthoate octaprenyltransferase